MGLFLSLNFFRDGKVPHGSSPMLRRSFTHRFTRTLVTKSGSVYTRKVSPVLFSEEEFWAVSKLQHPSLLPYSKFYSADNGYTLERPFIGCETLELFICRNECLTYGDTAKLLVHIASAVQYCHENMVIVKSLRPSNILLTDHGPVIVDFGMNAVFMDNTERDDTPGSFLHLGPEIFTGDSEPSFEKDIWALGLIAYLLFNRRYPWPTNNLPHLMKSMMECNITFLQGVPADVRMLVSTMLSKNKANRPPIKTVVRSLKRLSCLNDNKNSVGVKGSVEPVKSTQLSSGIPVPITRETKIASTSVKQLQVVPKTASFVGWRIREDGEPFIVMRSDSYDVFSE